MSQERENTYFKSGYHSGDADRQNSAWKPGNSRSHRTMQRRQNATYSDGDSTRTCKFCGQTHPQLPGMGENV